MSVPAHGGSLKNLLVTEARAEALRAEAFDLPSVTLSRRQLCDLELLLNGAFSPLEGFLCRADYEQVLATARLADGTLWPIPVTLALAQADAEGVEQGKPLALRDEEGFMLAVVKAAELWQPDQALEAEAVYGTASTEHPGVRTLLQAGAAVYVGGQVEGVQLPTHFDFQALWHTPQELRRQFNQSGWREVIAFQTSRPIHRLQRDLTLEMAKSEQANLLLHPAVGVTKPGDLEYYARVHCYQSVLAYFPLNIAMLSLLPLAMRMAGPREALWHGIIHKNYGCSAFIVGPDDSSPPAADGQSRFYERYAAQEYVAGFADQLGIRLISVEERRYVPARGCYLPVGQIEQEAEALSPMSDGDLKHTLARGEGVPEWFSFPEVLRHLERVHPPHSQLGFTLFFTGLSGSGKSTLARILHARLIENGQRPVTLLDGDIVRRNLSSELGFSREHRDLNIRRIGFVANEISKNGGVAVCAPIAPYQATRRDIRQLIAQYGAFIEIYLATPLAVCESRDRKGLYAKAREGLIPHFTGISDPYQEPEQAELTIDTSGLTPMEAAQQILLYLVREGFIDADAASAIQ